MQITKGCSSQPRPTFFVDPLDRERLIRAEFAHVTDLVVELLESYVWINVRDQDFPVSKLIIGNQH